MECIRSFRNDTSVAATLTNSKRFLHIIDGFILHIVLPPMSQADDGASVFNVVCEGQAAFIEGVNNIQWNVVIRQLLKNMSWIVNHGIAHVQTK